MNTEKPTKAHINPSNTLPWQICKIINVCHELHRTGGTGASTGERIAAALVLNRQDYLPEGYNHLVDAWDRLEQSWQRYVIYTHRNLRHLLP